MSEELPTFNPHADEMLEASKAQAERDLSIGILPPEQFEQQWVPEVESSFRNAPFNKFSSLLRDQVEHDKNLAYELRHMDESVLIDSLHRAGVISDQLVESGLLQTRFEPNRPRSANSLYQVGGLMHILLGDAAGGLHDIDTLHDAGLAGADQDTKVVSISQRYQGKPDIKYGLPVDEDKDGDIDRVDLKVAKGKTQFPENWTTDDVLLSIIAISELPPEPQKPGSQSQANFHTGVYNGIKVCVITNSAGEIVTGYPADQVTPYQEYSQSYPIAA